MIKSRKIRMGYINDVTEYLDMYLIKCENCISSYRNYIFDEPVGDTWAIRVPGATRGHIRVSDGKISEIKLYKDSFCYTEDVYNDLDKFVGQEIDLV